MAKKRLVVISDLHCGHKVGLTPPPWQKHRSKDKYDKIQIDLWKAFHKPLQKIKPIDILVVNGDAVEGKGTRSGATELIDADPNFQAEMAAYVIKDIKAKYYTLLTYGTAYHTGYNQDYEYNVFKYAEADKIGSHEWLDINGCIFDIKHHIGDSSIPHGKGTAPMRERLWNLIWSEDGEQPKADILIRSHVHSYINIEEENYRVITTPALQGCGSKFGSRKCSKKIHFGFVWFDVYNDGSYDCHKEIMEVESQKAKAIKL